jgi:hypothetical protein
MRNKSYLLKMTTKEYQDLKEGASLLNLTIADYLRCGLFAMDGLHLHRTREVR